MNDARSLLDEMRVSHAEHLPLVAAFPERMGLGRGGQRGGARPRRLSVNTK